jgi:hypothetical protein
MRRLLILIIGFLLLLVLSSYAGWTPPVRISDQGVSYGPEIAAGESALHVVYWTGGAFTSSFYQRSGDSGETWSEPLLLPDTMVTFNNVVPIIRLEDNRITIIWRSNIRGTDHLNFGLRLSTDEGSNWNDTEYILPEGQESLQKHAFSVSNSVLYFIYTRIDQGEIAFDFTKSTNWGGAGRNRQKSSEPKRLDSSTWWLERIPSI